ncbi:MAG TPA: aldo/keto reductase [Polyangia bacterium]|jgi:predicted aldo/keto reductase-like oxidoreductase
MDRRDFLRGASRAAGLAASHQLLHPLVAGAAGLPALQGPGERRGDMLYRPLGTTGVMVSAVGLGGFHIGVPDEQDGIRIIHAAIDRGVTFLDNCWDYNGGVSERRMGAALAGGRRHKVFLMTKIDGRDRATAARQIDESLERLRTDHVDLMQLHEVIRAEDPDRAFAAGGAIEALVAARGAGKVRFIGFTGHKDPFIHRRMLASAAAHGFRFDTVQMPLNLMDAHFRSFAREVLPLLVAQGIGVLGMKPLGGGVILRSRTVSAIDCLHYALNLPTATVITGIDRMAMLEQALQAAKTFQPLTTEQVDALLARTRHAAVAGAYELYKTQSRFDGTARHPEWLG